MELNNNDDNNPFVSPRGSSQRFSSPHPLTNRRRQNNQDDKAATQRNPASSNNQNDDDATNMTLTPRNYYQRQQKSPTRTDNSSTLVNSARKEWNLHGKALTQDLEETRIRDEETLGTLTARLTSAENRFDVTGKKYTSYILQVKLPNRDVLQLEHRYSEFAKLNDIFLNQCVYVDAIFPPKNLAGRIGNWTPSLSWAPEKFDDLVRYRKIQLDVWLVEVAAKYNSGDLPHMLARSVYEFLTLSDRPPCDIENLVSSSLAIANNYDDNKSGHNSNDSMIRWNNPISFTLGSSIRQATRILEKLTSDSDQSIPLDLLHCAKGLIFLTVVKAGLVVSGRIGTGLLVSRVDDGQHRWWSAPVALGTIGMGYGMVVGGDITHYLVILTTEEAVESMLSGSVQLGIDVGIAIGPLGRSSSVSGSTSNTQWTVHPAYSYAHSKGLFMGLSLEGSILSSRNDVNSKFYGRPGLTSDLILEFPQPKAAEVLYDALERALAKEIKDDDFRPSRLFNDSIGNTITNNSNNTSNNNNCNRISSGHGSSFYNDSIHVVENFDRVKITSDVPSPGFYR